MIEHSICNWLRHSQPPYPDMTHKSRRVLLAADLQIILRAFFFQQNSYQPSDIDILPLLNPFRRVRVQRIAAQVWSVIFQEPRLGIAGPKIATYSGNEPDNARRLSSAAAASSPSSLIRACADPTVNSNHYTHRYKSTLYKRHNFF